MSAFGDDLRRWVDLDYQPQGAERVPVSLGPGLVVKLLVHRPAIWATAFYRASHWAHQRRLRGLPTFFERLNLFWFGFQISSSMPVGPGLYIPHPVGSVIMARSIGANASFIHAVTLGMRNRREFPTVGDDVFVGAGARILGGVTIGDGATVGANAVVIADVPAGATAVGIPARIIPAGD